MSAEIEMEGANALRSIPPFIINFYKVHFLVIMIMNFCLMDRVIMIVGPVISGVFMVVNVS